MTTKFTITDLSTKKQEQELLKVVKSLIPEPIIPKDGTDGKTPTKEELLSLMKPLIPEIPKNLTKGEIKAIIADYIDKSKVEPPTLDFEMKETEQGTEITIGDKKHLIPRTAYAPKLRNIQQMGDFFPGTNLVGQAGKSIIVAPGENGFKLGTSSGGGSVDSVTGLNTDNTDPTNPIVRISVDGTTITGAGTPGSPLVAIGSQTLGYTHAQIPSLSEWTITHNLGFHPNVSIQDSATDLVMPNKIIYDSLDIVRVQFLGSMSGYAYLS